MKWTGTSGPRASTSQWHICFSSSSVSFAWGMTKFVTSNQTSVSWTSHWSVWRTGSKWPLVSFQ